MLDPQRTTIAKLKQAYDLNVQEAEALLCALSPGGVFPYALWQKAYSTFWMGPVYNHARIYNVDRIQLPEAGEIPDKYFPTETFSAWIITFLVRLADLIYAADMEKGIDYIILETYGGDNFPFKTQKNALFDVLKEEEKTLRQIARLTILDKNITFYEQYYTFVPEFFSDTIVVDKAAAVRYLGDSGYSWRRETKGLSQAIVERILAGAPALQPQAETHHAPAPSAAIFVSRSLWEGKSPMAVREGMRQHDFKDPVIAYALHEWCGLKNKTQIGRLLGPGDQDDSSYLRLTNRLLAEAADLNIHHA